MAKHHITLWAGLATFALICSCGDISTEEVAAPRQAGGASDGDNTQGDGTFETTAQPLFSEFCVKCHNSSSKTGGVDLSSYMGVIESGVVEPGDPDKSRVMQMLERNAMPPPGNASPSDEEIALIRDWIAAGAVGSHSM